MNLAYALELRAYTKSDSTAVVFNNNNYTYKQIDREANRYANMMRNLGIESGDRVSIWLPNGMEFIYAFYGILKIGAITVPINYLFKKMESIYILENSGAKLLITSEEKLQIVDEIYEQLSELNVITTNANVQSNNPNILAIDDQLENVNDERITLDLSPDHGACILYTSGTTGNPKGVELSHYNLNTNAEFYAESIKLTDEHYGCIVTPLSHLLVLMAGMTLIFLKGAKFYLFERYSTRTVAETINKEKINFFIGVPSMYYMFLTLPEEEKYDMSSLEICITSGAHMPSDVRRKFEQRYNTITLQAYGQTESSPVISVDQLGKERKFDSVGFPLPHVDVQIVNADGKVLPAREKGEIIARGHCVMKGYWNNPKETKKTVKDGWLYTGDIGKVDDDGYVYFLDRKKEMIISGGYNIYPKELEDVLYQHSAVLEASVIGIPDERLGEIPKAYIVTKDGNSVTDDEIKHFAQERLASYKRIWEVEFIDELPKTVTGKLMKRKLLDRGKQKENTNQKEENDV
ncbi:class I adenylate-forming enzyme family protein [Oceanobacillus sp. CF4.6]|uniref:class I adenylate-forming enzyme family protein n=1 Tax=Oceanobacillus sp. CF4.6 TaxID=3373080 RepID=UPI003EE479AE